MGTHALTIIRDNNWTYNTSREICVMFRHFDSYPKIHGRELAKFLNGIQMVDSVPFEANYPETDHLFYKANGFECLAAQIIAHFKKNVGNIYLCSAGTRNCNESYTYIISNDKDGQINIKIKARNYLAPLFEGNPSKMIRWIEKYFAK